MQGAKSKIKIVGAGLVKTCASLALQVLQTSGVLASSQCDEEAVLLAHDPTESLCVHVGGRAVSLGMMHLGEIIVSDQLDGLTGSDPVLQGSQHRGRYVHDRAGSLLELQQRIPVGHVQQGLLPSVDPSRQCLAILPRCMSSAG